MAYKKPCPKCGSKDNLVVFDDGGEYCFTPGCGVKVLSEEYRKPEIYEEEEDIPMFQEQWNAIKSKTIASGRGFRGIRDDIYAKFGVRHEYQKVLMNGEEKEELIAQYYPLTRKGESAVEICGTKIRYVPKRFMARGVNKQSETHLFGQANFINSLSKTVVLVAGEADTLATYQMLLDNLRDHAPAVVSGTCGEGAVGQYRAQYEFLNKFDRIILIPDSDKAGREAMKKAVQALPKDKIYVIHIPEIYKDPNGMLLAGKEDDFTTLYFRAKPYVPDGVVGSSELYHNLLESTLLPKIPLPPFLHELQDMLAGGFVLESIVNIAAASGLGALSPSDLGVPNGIGSPRINSSNCWKPLRAFYATT